jgi:hypothetical protein
MNSLRFGLAAIGLAMLLAAALGEADAGANSGGGFYDGSNINVGHVNPSSGSCFDRVYTSVGQAKP